MTIAPIHKQRIRKLTLLTIVDDADFDIYENAISQTIKTFESKGKKIQKKIDTLYKKMPPKLTMPQMDDEVVFIDSIEDVKLTTELGDLQLERESVELQLKALNEMKIIYLFKQFETHLKLIFEHSYDINTRKFYKWQNIEEFLKEKGFKKDTLKFFSLIEELKQVNNAIKHTHQITEEVKRIHEFAKETDFNSINLSLFYTRVKKCIKPFLKSLVSSIWNDLFVFKEERIDEIAKSYRMRMNNDDLNKLAKKIQEQVTT